jgi:hypothetical protein
MAAAYLNAGIASGTGQLDLLENPLPLRERVDAEA